MHALRERYLWIAKNSLDFLREHGFKKKDTSILSRKMILFIMFILLFLEPRGSDLDLPLPCFLLISAFLVLFHSFRE